jgi:hypothetical protein
MKGLSRSEPTLSTAITADLARSVLGEVGAIAESASLLISNDRTSSFDASTRGKTKMMSSQTEGSLSQPVFVVLLCVGYAYIVLWFVFMFRTALFP